MNSLELVDKIFEKAPWPTVAILVSAVALKYATYDQVVKRLADRRLRNQQKLIVEISKGDGENDMWEEFDVWREDLDAWRERYGREQINQAPDSGI